METGIRPGEKLEELLASPDEYFTPTSTPRLLSANAVSLFSADQKLHLLEKLKIAAENIDHLQIRELLGLCKNE